MLTPAQLAQYRDLGYVAVPALFTPREVAAMRARLQALVDAGQLRNVHTQGDGTTHSTTAFNLQICPLSPHDRLFRALKFHPRLVAAARDCVGDPLLFKLDQIFLKPARHGAGTGWHQDNGYWKVDECTAGVGAWTALHEATVANGTMHVIPRSHLRAEPHERDPGSDHHIRAVRVREEDAVPIELPAGGVLLFNWGVLHCTRANRTDRERAGLALHFCNGRLRPLFAQDRQLVWITGPEATGGCAEYGERIAGAWEAEVAAALAGAGATAGPARAEG